ncbi:MAG: hypothetical protein JXK93_00855 [Sphaerochaetaceae bacterium]|nr:hypothetical protein [Sphaerochaetaceae bacterium]
MSIRVTWDIRAVKEILVLPLYRVKPSVSGSESRDDSGRSMWYRYV